MLFFNCNFWSIFWIGVVSFVLIRVTAVFSRFIVIPVALFKVWKNARTFVTGSWFFRNRLESSAHQEIFVLLYVVHCIPVIDLLLLIMEVVASACIIYKGRGNGNPCLKKKLLFFGGWGRGVKLQILRKKLLKFI